MSYYQPVRLRRFGAFLCDWHTIGVPMISFAFSKPLLDPRLRSFPPFFFLFLLPICWYCRDWLLGGHSIGKWAFGLSVVDRETGGPATGKQLLRKSLSLLITPIDALVLLFTGRSIGERISGTAVVCGKYPGPIVKKRFLAPIALAAVPTLLCGGFITLRLNQAKENESYTLALGYLTESAYYAELEEPGTAPVLTGFASSPLEPQPFHEYTFETDSRNTYTVTCHPSGDGWAVCGECTEFE